MAIPPTIPTSFVPKQPVQTTRRARSGTNLFMFAAFLIAGLSFVAAGAVFGYQKYLEALHEKRAAELKAAEESISRSTVEEFIRLRDRFIATDRILDQHVALSQFLDLLEGVTLQNVQFGTLDIVVEDDRSATISMKGTARNFNALAAESAAFAAEKRIRRAIFSSITVNDNGSVSFSLAAELEPEIVTWMLSPSEAAAAQSAPVIPQAATLEQNGSPDMAPTPTPTPVAPQQVAPAPQPTGTAPTQ